LPTGTINPDETVEQCAERTLVDGVGLRPLNIKPLLHFFSSPHFSTEKIYLFEASHLMKSPQDLVEGVDLVTFSQEEAVAAVLSGKIIDAKTIIGIFYHVAITR